MASRLESEIRMGLEQLCGENTENRTQTYLRILPSKRTSISDYSSSVKINEQAQMIVLSQTHKSTQKTTSRELSVRNVFDSSCSNQFIQDKLLSLDNFQSALSWTLRGFNTGIVTYGEVCSGKTYTLFGNPDSNFFTFALEQLAPMVESSSIQLGLSIWELVYSAESRSEVIMDLIRSSSVIKELECVQIRSFEEGMKIWSLARETSSNWKDSSEEGLRFINNRSHFFIRFTILKDDVVSNLHIVDLAGFLPGQLSADIRQKLPSDDQITCTRVGLNQFKNAVWELSRGEVDLNEILSTRTSKIVQMMGPLLGGNCRNYILGTVKEDSEFLGALHTIELLQKAAQIKTKCFKLEGSKTRFTTFEGKRPSSPLTPRTQKSKEWLEGFANRKKQIMQTSSPLKEKYFENRPDSPIDSFRNVKKAEERKQDNYEERSSFENLRSDFRQQDSYKNLSFERRDSPQDISQDYSYNKRDYSYDFSQKRKETSFDKKESSFSRRVDSPIDTQYIDNHYTSPENTNPKLTSIKSQINEMLDALESPALATQKPDNGLKEDSFKKTSFKTQDPYKKYESFKKHENFDSHEAFKTHDSYKKYEPFARKDHSGKERGSQTPENMKEDKEMAKMRGEYYVLKNDYEQLLEEVFSKEKAQAQQSALAAELSHEIEELKATYELQLDDIRLENTQLRQKLRILQESSDGFVVFEQYEDDIAKLEYQISQLRDNVLLKFEAEEKPVMADDLDEATILNNKMKRTVKELKKTIGNLTRDLKDKEKENWDLKRKERKWNISQKCLFNVTKKTSHLQNIVGKQSKSLESNEQTFNEMMKEIERLKKENDSLKNQVEDLNRDNVRMSKDLVIMRDIATSSGLPQDTLERLHKNVANPPLTQGKFAVNLLNKLQKDMTGKHVQAVENIKYEVNNLYDALQSANTREQNLMCLLVDMQEKQDKVEKGFGKEWNRQLRDTLMSTLNY